jgi:hypothetical protein
MILPTTLVSSLDSAGGDWGSAFPSTSSTSAKPSAIEPKEMIAASSVIASRKSTMSTNLDISRNDVSKFQELEVVIDLIYIIILTRFLFCCSIV